MQLLLIVKQENPNREREREISISEEKKTFIFGDFFSTKHIFYGIENRNGRKNKFIMPKQVLR